MSKPLHYAFNHKQPEFFQVPTEDVNDGLEPEPSYQGDDVCEYL